MRALGPAALIALTGCLSIPAETPNDGSVFDASGAYDAPLFDANGDAGINACGDKAQFPGMTFPPDPNVRIRDVVAADLNNDGYTDLLITSAETTDQADYGFFVLLGPQTDYLNLEYHAFVPTNVSPLGVAVKDVLGLGSCLDVAVWGKNKGDTAGLVEVYEWDASPDLFDAANPVSKGSLFNPGADGPVLITFGDFSGAGHGNDIVVADLFELRLLPVSIDFANTLPTSVPVDIGNTGTPGGWDAINGVYARRSMRTGIDADDLVVVENLGMSWMFNDGSGGFTTPAPVVASSSGLWNSKGVSVVDLDGAPPMDFIGSGGNSFGGYLISQNGQTVTIVTRPWNTIFAEIFNELYSVGVADHGGTNAPEILVVDEGNGAADRGSVYLVDTLFETSGELEPKGYHRLPLTSTNLNFRHLEITDFDGDSELETYLFTLEGQARCVRRKQSVGELEFCP